MELLYFIKARTHKYYKRIPKKTGKGYRYFYTKSEWKQYRQEAEGKEISKKGGGFKFDWNIFDWDLIKKYEDTDDYSLQGIGEDYLTNMARAFQKMSMEKSRLIRNNKQQLQYDKIKIEDSEKYIAENKTKLIDTINKIKQIDKKLISIPNLKKEVSRLKKQNLKDIPYQQKQNNLKKIQKMEKAIDYNYERKRKQEIELVKTYKERISQDRYELKHKKETMKGTLATIKTTSDIFKYKQEFVDFMNKNYVNKKNIEIIDVSVSMQEGKDFFKPIKKLRYGDSISAIIKNKHNGQYYKYYYNLAEKSADEGAGAIASDMARIDYDDDRFKDLPYANLVTEDDNFQARYQIYKKQILKAFGLNKNKKMIVADAGFGHLNDYPHSLNMSYDMTNIKKGARAVINATADALKSGLYFYNSLLDKKVNLMSITASPLTEFKNDIRRQQAYVKTMKNVLKKIGATVKYGYANTEGDEMKFLFDKPIGHRAMLKKSMELVKYFIKSVNKKEYIIKLLTEVCRKKNKDSKGESNGKVN